MDRHKGQVVGYVRVSTVDQHVDRQVEALGEVDRMFTDMVSGVGVQRPQLQGMLGYLREGDTVRVKSPDRLSRSTTDLLTLIKRLQAKRVDVEFVDNPALNTTTPQGEFMLTVLAAVSQLERSITLERQAEGIAIAKRKGVYERPPALTVEQVASARRRIEQGVPKSAVARDLGVSRQTLYTALDGKGVYGTADESE